MWLGALAFGVLVDGAHDADATLELSVSCGVVRHPRPEASEVGPYLAAHEVHVHGAIANLG